MRFHLGRFHAVAYATIFFNFFSGKEVEGLWHTAIIVYEKEYFFGSDGIKSCPVVRNKMSFLIVTIRNVGSL